MLLGCDVSRWQGTMDWQKAKANGIQFAFIKATEGLTWVDPQVHNNDAGLRAVGIPFGSYHYFRPSLSAEGQARHFAQYHKGQWVVADVETRENKTPSQIAAMLRTFMDVLESETGKHPYVYTRKTFWDPYVAADFSQYPLWVAHYGAVNPWIPRGWTDWTVWQWTSSGDGIKYGAQSREIDLNWAREIPGVLTLEERVSSIEARLRAAGIP